MSVIVFFSCLLESKFSRFDFDSLTFGAVLNFPSASVETLEFASLTSATVSHALLRDFRTQVLRDLFAFAHFEMFVV